MISIEINRVIKYIIGREIEYNNNENGLKVLLN